MTLTTEYDKVTLNKRGELMADSINIAPTSFIPFIKLALEVDLPSICEKAGIDINECYTYGILQELMAVVAKMEKFVEETKEIVQHA